MKKVGTNFKTLENLLDYRAVNAKKLHPDLDYALNLKLISNFRRSYDNEDSKFTICLNL